MQYANFLAFLLATPALLSLIIAAPTPLPADSLKRGLTEDGGMPIAGESPAGQPIQMDGLRPANGDGGPGGHRNYLSGFDDRRRSFQAQKRQYAAFADEIPQQGAPPATQPAPPKPAPPAGNGHGVPGNSGTGPGTNTNGLTPEQQRAQGNRISAGIAHDDTHKRQIALGDEIAQPPTPNTDTNPPPKPAQPAPPAGNGHGVPGNSGTGPGTNTNGLTREQQLAQGNRISAGIAHDDTHKRQIALGDEIAQPPTPNTDTNPPPKPAQPVENGHAAPGNSGTGPGKTTDGMTPEQQRAQANHIQADIAHDDTH